MRLECLGDQLAGWVRTYLGEIRDGVTLLQRALERAPDPVAALAVRGPLGLAQMEVGAMAAATESLEQTVAACRQLGMLPQYESWVTAWLGEACLVAGRPERARSLAEQALAQGGNAGFPLAMGLAPRLRGRLAARAGAHDEGADYLHEAVRLFAACGARYEAALTQLDLAPVAHRQGQTGTAAQSLTDARSSFEAMQIPRYASQAADVARELGLEPL